jgi:hypothetical protein
MVNVNGTMYHKIILTNFTGEQLMITTSSQASLMYIHQSPSEPIELVGSKAPVTIYTNYLTTHREKHCV